MRNAGGLLPAGPRGIILAQSAHAAVKTVEISFGPLLEAVFERRPNRYLAWVRLRDGNASESVPVHVPDPGRMRELLLPGRRVWVAPASARANPRTTQFTLAIVESPASAGGAATFVSVNTIIPNKLISRALLDRALPEFEGFTDVRAEVPHGRSRFDFVLTSATASCVLEVKSVSLTHGRTGLFPDAVSARATRHVGELAGLCQRGERAAVLFVAQRNDVDEIRPAEEIDPVFASAMKDAKKAGVDFFGFRCEVSLDGIRLGSPVPVG
ncbi:MAG TPA: DNA/RNA nuclease SfsA [Candidatus Latescibacteria bacterium]|nr:DNA/RNA nuclease SfsA [Candidatus Latescibacterota bacterium]